MTPIIEALQWRYATKIFDASKKVSDDDVKTILESARLAPSSFGIEAWKFLVIENPEVRAKLRAAGYDQPKITDASHLIVIARRTDVKEHIATELIARTAKAQGKKPEDLAGYHQMVQGSADRLSDDGVKAWAAGQTYIALGMMMETASMLHVDNCPMEGFNKDQVDEILGLGAKNLASVTMLAIGYRGEDPQAALPKVRRDFDEVIEFVK